MWDATGVRFLTYVLSFAYVGIYWNNHHHVFQLVDRVSGSVLWSNLHLLFWLSLFPFTTGWMAESDLARTPTVVYGINLLMAGIAYTVLEYTISRLPGEGQRYRAAVGNDRKGLLSMVLYISGIVLATWQPKLAMIVFVIVALLWFFPDRRIERYLADSESAIDANG